MSEKESSKPMLLIGVAIFIVLGIGVVSYLSKKNSTLSAQDEELLKSLKEDEKSQNTTENAQADADTTTQVTDVPEPKPVNSDNIKSMTKPEMQIDTKKQYIATLKTTEGDIKIKLYADKTPVTVNNFVYLSKNGFYNNTIFHRVIDGFMIQGGDPLGNGTGDPGYKFDDEKFDGEYKRGILAMANSGPNTNGSQFFIMHKDNPLPKNYVIFGEVLEGLDVVDKIATAETTYGGMGEKSTPVKPVKITEAVISEN